MSGRHARRWSSLLAAAGALAACGAVHAGGARLIVQFDPADVEAAFSPKSRIERLQREADVAAMPVRRLAAGAHLVELPEGADAVAAARAAMSRGGAKIAVPDRRLKRARSANDTNLQSQTYLRNDATTISAFAAWDLTTGSASTVVAVLDTGILPHPDFAGRVLPGYDFVSDPLVANDGNGRDADPTDPGDWLTQADLDTGHFPDCEIENSSWHGTSVAGVIGANSNNSLAVAGIDWAAKILPVRVLGKCGGDFSDIFDAIAWSAGFPVPGVPSNPTPAHLLNLSLGGASDAPCTAEEDALIAQFVTPTGLRAIFAAAGNESGDANLHFPSSCPSTISVAATAISGQRASYTNTGSTVDLSAPGGDSKPGTDFGLIAVLSNNGSTVPGAYSVHGAQGTSFSTPIVAGVASLMLAVAPSLTSQQLRTALTSTTKPFPETSNCTFLTCGTGIVNAEAAVQAAAASGQTASKVTVVEYFNAGFGHYFITARADEIALLDGGAFNGAFVRTGASFKAWDGPSAGTQPVCRFFTEAFPPKSSHFYTAYSFECEGLKSNPDWIYETIAFHAGTPVAGACPAGTTAVWRLYNNGASGAPNHRFTTDLGVYQSFIATQGWTGEGIVFCAPS
ncbi:MAG: S8 family peptidase [Burkholderiales bacterium]